MKILLIRPPILQLRSNLSAYGAILPIGLAYIAAILKERGHDVGVVDAAGEALDRFTEVPSPLGTLTRQGLSPDEVLSRIPEDAEVVGISHMFLHEWPTIRELCEKVKNRFPSMKIVLGGENATAFWKRIFEETDAVDYCILGEGEQTILKLLEAIPSHRAHALHNARPPAEGRSNDRRRGTSSLERAGEACRTAKR